VGIKALVSAAAMPPTTTAPAPLATRLRSGEVRMDGLKGLPLSFRAWDGQLRQPIFLGHADGVAGTAPLDGVLHPVDTLDTLGREDKEQPCLKK
jgi:ABC transporter substrate binding protein (PQQ-dependent alcohol dehydrogenase system)